MSNWLKKNMGVITLPLKKDDPTLKEKRRLKYLYESYRSTEKISKELNISTYLVKKWMKLLKLKRVGICSWCGKKRVGKRIKVRGKKDIWLCRECNAHRCKRCSIILSNKKICSNHLCHKKHGAYRLGSEYCLECEKIIKKSYPQGNY